MIEYDLKELISITYTDKMYLLFNNISLKNSTIKHTWFGVVMKLIFFWKVS